jgi:peptidoglycan hydrolase FlgJ
MNISSINTVADAKRLFAAEKQALKTDGATPQSAQELRDLEARKQASVAAKQFEAIMLRQLLSPVIEPLMSGGSVAGQSVKSGGGVYGYLVTDVMANSLSQGRGMGLSTILEKQLTPKGSVTTANAAAAYKAGKVNNHE